MPFDIDEAIKNLESTAVKVAAQEIMKHLVVHVWAGFAWPVVGPVVGYVVSYIAGILMERLDWVTYMVVENWAVTIEGKEFVKKAADLAAAEAAKDQAAIDAALKAKEDAFRKLIGLGSVA